jgi:pyruvate dehydrogenase E1 component alpha subunit
VSCAVVEGILMNERNSAAPLGRRAALAGRVERLARMIEIRCVENRVQRLFSEGQVRGSTHLCSGQEAVSVGIASETRPDDIVSCTYRGHGHALALGLGPEQVIGEICGRSIGCAGGLGGSMHLAEPSVGLMPTAAIVGAGLPIACGAALAAKVRKSDRVSVAVFGDGTANIGAFHEALNLAAIQKLAVVFVCENNLYGEYTRINFTTPIENIADRAASYGIPGEVVDGQDIDAVTRSMARAVAKARKGEGSSLLEMKTYRYSGHSRSDPATYRPAGELDVWLKRDPIELFARVLTTEGIIQSGDLDRMKGEASEAVEAAVQRVLTSMRPETREILAHITG